MYKRSGSADRPWGAAFFRYPMTSPMLFLFLLSLRMLLLQLLLLLMLLVAVAVGRRYHRDDDLSRKGGVAAAGALPERASQPRSIVHLASPAHSEREIRPLQKKTCECGAIREAKQNQQQP
jgi:hypothetical protein